MKNLIKPPKTLVVLAFMALLACEAHPVESPPKSPPPTVALPALPAPGTAPSNDVSLPPVGASSPKTNEGGSEAATGSVLTPKELNTQMPLPGQVNDHSTPLPAKQGDSQAPAKQTR